MDSNAKHLTNIYELYIFKQLVTEPTRFTANSSSIVDHIATTSPRSIAKAGEISISLSDQFMVFCVRKFEVGVLKDHKTIKTRRVENFNEQMFLTDVASINWIRALGQTDDINILVSNWPISFHRSSRNMPLFKRCESRISIAPWSMLILGHLLSLRMS